MMKAILIFLALLGVEVSAANYSYEWKPQDTYRPARDINRYFKDRPHTWVYPSPAMLCIYNSDPQALLDLLARDPHALSATTPILDTKAAVPTPDPRRLGQWKCNGWNYLAEYGYAKLFKQCDAIEPGGWRTPNSVGCTPMMLAAARPYQLDIIKYMVEQGADVNQQNHRGSTVLDFAIHGSKDFTPCCKEDDTDPNGIVKYLRSKGGKTQQELKSESVTQAVPRPLGKPGLKK
jgi:hypothetical protein